MKLFITILLLCSLVLGTAACASEPGASKQDMPAIESYRDIPGITAEEVASIEALLSERQSFSFGSLLSPDIFEHDDGSYGGFIPLLCELLSGLFGVDFVPELLEWNDLHSQTHAQNIDFTSAINKPVGLECPFYHSSPLAGNKLSVFVKAGGRQIVSEYDLRGLQIGFYDGSYTENTMRIAFPYVDFDSVGIGTSGEMAEMLRSGEIDAFICDTADVFAFYEHEGIIMATDFPNVYIPVSISTSVPELTPIVTAITRYLMAGGNAEIERLYDIGEHDYAANAIWHTLTDAERAYIDALATSGEKVAIGATAARYPVAFYDRESKEFAGIAIDVLNEISLLTGIEFYFRCDENTTWGELEGMLKDGEIALLSQLIPNEPRKEYAIWPDAPYFTARYALLSNVDFPFLSNDQVPYARVGMTRGTAEETKYKEWFPEDTSYKTYTSTDEGLLALENGEVDLFFSLDYTLLYESNYRENPSQKINILFDEPIEPVPFGLNKDEVILCSIISKAQNIINTDKIARSWTSRIFDQSAQLAEERTRNLAIFSCCLLVMLVVLAMLYMRSQRLKENVEVQAQATLEANRNLQVLLDMAPAGIIISRRGDGGMLYANRAGLDMFACRSFEQDVENRKSFDYMPEFQPDGKRSLDVVAEFWGQDEGLSELCFIKRTGESFIARVAYRVINYYGELASLNVVEDMTAEKERQAMLQNIATQEQEANQLKSRFLATMSHEIRTPMNAIIGMTDLALREVEPNVKNDHILTIKQAGANLLSLINDILDFSKIEAGKMEIVPVDYSVATLLDDVVSIIRMRAADSHLQFAVKADSNIPRVLYGDETRVRQALLNLLGNAVKYTEEGFVTLGVYIDSTVGDDANLIFEVSDSGMGIKPEDMSKLFTDFTQLNLESNRKTEGVGLGLAITKSIVEAMGGSISVQSEYGKGSTFTITMPQRVSASEPLASVSSSAKKMLVYEQSDVYADSIAYALDNMGISCTLAENESEFYKALENNNNDYLFISHDLYLKYKNTIQIYSKDAKVAVLSEFGEAGISETNVIALTMPVYCTVIADVVSGVYEKNAYAAENESALMFEAPDASILIVDDIKSNLKVAEGLLAPYNMHVDLADSGMAAIEAIQKAEKPYDLIFMDHKMPVMDGVETVRRIREMDGSGSYCKDVPIVALTANVVSGMEEMFLSHGFSDFLSKPIDTSKLGAVLDKWIPTDKRA